VEVATGRVNPNLVLDKVTVLDLMLLTLEVVMRTLWELYQSLTSKQAKAYVLDLMSLEGPDFPATPRFIHTAQYIADSCRPHESFEMDDVIVEAELFELEEYRD